MLQIEEKKNLRPETHAPLRASHRFPVKLPANTSGLRIQPALSAESYLALAQRPAPGPSAGLILKSVVDRVGAAIGLILLSPVFAFVVWKVKKDGGPAFFGHTRIGHNGKAFKCWKFRSMDINSAQILADLLVSDPEARAEWEKDFKLKNDPRITKIGHFIRKTSIDEIPQLFNVLKGEMSLVGPRPIVKDEVKYYRDKIVSYCSVKPGITGLWQVSGRNDVSYTERVQLDCQYVRQWSFWNDIVILFKTVGVIVNRKGAY